MSQETSKDKILGFTVDRFSKEAEELEAIKKDYITPKSMGEQLGNAELSGNLGESPWEKKNREKAEAEAVEAMKKYGLKSDAQIEKEARDAEAARNKAAIDQQFDAAAKRTQEAQAAKEKEEAEKIQSEQAQSAASAKEEEKTILGYNEKDLTAQQIQELQEIEKKHMPSTAKSVGRGLVSALVGGEFGIVAYNALDRRDYNKACKDANKHMKDKYNIDPPENQHSKTSEKSANHSPPRDQSQAQNNENANTKSHSNNKEDENGKSKQTWLEGFKGKWNDHLEKQKAREEKERLKEQKIAQKKAKDSKNRHSLTGQSGILGGMKDAAFNAAMYMHPIGYICKMAMKGEKKMGVYEWKSLAQRPTGDPFNDFVSEAVKSVPENYTIPPSMVQDAENALAHVDKTSKDATVKQRTAKCKDGLEKAPGPKAPDGKTLQTPNIGKKLESVQPPKPGPGGGALGR